MKENKRLYLSLIVSIISVFTIFVLIFSIAKFEGYQEIDTSNYNNLFQTSSLFLLFSTLTLLIIGKIKNRILESILVVANIGMLICIGKFYNVIIYESNIYFYSGLYLTNILKNYNFLHKISFLLTSIELINIYITIFINIVSNVKLINIKIINLIKKLISLKKFKLITYSTNLGFYYKTIP